MTHLKKQVPSLPFPVSRILYCDLPFLCHRLLPGNWVILLELRWMQFLYLYVLVCLLISSSKSLAFVPGCWNQGQILYRNFSSLSFWVICDYCDPLILIETWIKFLNMFCKSVISFNEYCIDVLFAMNCQLPYGYHVCYHELYW